MDGQGSRWLGANTRGGTWEGTWHCQAVEEFLNGRDSVHFCAMFVQKSQQTVKSKWKGIVISGKVAMLSGRCGLWKTNNQAGPGQSCGEQKETLEALGV